MNDIFIPFEIKHAGKVLWPSLNTNINSFCTIIDDHIYKWIRNSNEKKIWFRIFKTC